MRRGHHCPALRHVFGRTGHLRSRVHPVAVPGLLSLFVVFALLVSPRVATAQESALASEKTEFAVVPLVGGDSDVGFGGGALGSLTNLVPGLSPYRWRIEAGVIATFKPPEGGNGITAPYQDAYLLYTVPDLIYRKLRLEVRPFVHARNDAGLPWHRQWVAGRHDRLARRTVWPSPPYAARASSLVGRRAPFDSGGELAHVQRDRCSA